MNRLKSGFAGQQSAMLCQTQINLIASCGKSFSDGEFAKKCLNTVVVEMCLDEKGALNMVSSGPGPADECNDMQDTAQLILFIEFDYIFDGSKCLTALQGLYTHTHSINTICI